jgi:hypothetical protein
MTRRVVRAGLIAALCLVGVGWFAREAAAQSCTPLTAGGIQGQVWFDENGDGIRNADELANGIAGVQVQLLDSSGAVLRTVTTSTGVGSILGTYSFFPLCGGTYTVRVVEATLPAGYVATIEGATPDPSRDSSTSPVTLAIVWDPTIGRFSKHVAIDFGYKAGCTGSIGDFVWNDSNQDGVQDPGEPGMAGREVRLLLSGSVIATDITDANGGYNFPGLCPGTYTVETDTPAGMTASPTLGTPDAALDSEASPVVVPLALNENNPTIDFGFYFPCLGTIGDFVWYDTNRNGVQDAGELGIANVTVELLDAGGAVIQTDITDANGAYLFTGLCAGTYGVRVNAATLPAGYVATPTLQGGDPTQDSNPSPTSVTLPTNNSNDLTIDFGYNAPCAGRLGDFVWNDANANGVQDAGEAGLPGVTVVLYDAGGAVVAVDTTDASGYYLFEGLCGGSFVVEVNPDTLPGGATGWLASPPNAGGDDLLDSDGIDHRTSASLPDDFTEDLSYDFGYYKAQPLTVTKTAAGRYDRTYRWTLAKTVDDNSHAGWAGLVAGSSTWSVSTTRSVVDSNYAVTGQIEITNPNGFAVAFSVSDVLSDGTEASVSCPGDSVAAGATVTCSYSASPSGSTATLNTATVTSTTTGVDGGVATAPVTFSANVTGDPTVTLGDVRFGYSQLISAATSPTFPETFTCPANTGQYVNGLYTFNVVNTARLVGANTNLSASATVTVTCRAEVWKDETAVGAGTRYPGSSNWFMYSPYTTSTINLIAGQKYDAGDITMWRTGSGSTARTWIRITLHSGFRWAAVPEVLKVQPFNTRPTRYYEPGSFLYKFTAPSTSNNANATVSFSGSTVTVSMLGTSAQFYGIHGSVQRLLP